MKQLTVSDGSSSLAERMRWSLVSVQFLVVLALGICPSSGQVPWQWCLCPSRNLCQLIPADHQYQVEVIMFDQGGTNWQHYDWSKITTVVVNDAFDPKIVCGAHKNKVRVILQAKINLEVLSNQNQRTKWINYYTLGIKRFFMDGINLEVRHTIDSESELYNDLTRMVRDIVQTFHEEIPGSQVSFNVPWSPCMDKRCYDFAEIANACDLLMVTSFDVQSLMMDECFAKANAPYFEVFTGLLNYIRLGIDSRKLIMGVPWFGYDYLCEQFFEPGRCYVTIPPLGVGMCGSLTAKVVPYKDIIQQLPNSITGRYWDDNHKAPYYVYKEGEKYHEVWYDDPESISLKSSILKKLKLRGISMSAGNYLNYSTDPLTAMQTEQMWNALCPF